MSTMIWTLLAAMQSTGAAKRMKSVTNLRQLKWPGIDTKSQEDEVMSILLKSIFSYFYLAAKTAVNNSIEL